MTECPRNHNTNFNRNHMAYPTLFHAVGTQCLISAFLPFVCLFPVFFPGDSQFYEEDTLLWIRPRYNVWLLFCYIDMLRIFSIVIFIKLVICFLGTKKPEVPVLPLCKENRNTSSDKGDWLNTYLIPYNCMLFVLRIITWSYNYLLWVIINSYLKLYNCEQRNDYYLIWIITLNHIIV